MEVVLEDIISKNNIAIASDHAGFALKSFLKQNMETLGFKVEDLGPDSDNSVDYPDFALKLATHMNTHKGTRGVLICGSGIGMSIAANRFPFIRAALARSVDDAVLCRQHNDANVLVLGARFTENAKALDILKAFLDTDFSGGRHIARVQKLSSLKDN